MARYTCDPNIELTGMTAQGFLHGLNTDNFRHILAKYDLDTIDLNAWYPLQGVLDVLSDISELPGAMMDLVSIGVRTADTSPAPPEVLNLPPSEFFARYDDIYQQRHRGGDVGHIRARIVSEDHIIIVANIPYPDDALYGIIYGWARRLAAAGQSLTVAYDDSQPRREHGGDHTVLHVEYGGW